MDAEKNCSETHQSHLASIMTKEENDFVRMYVYNMTGANPFVWLGLENEGLFNGITYVSLFNFFFLEKKKDQTS